MRTFWKSAVINLGKICTVLHLTNLFYIWQLLQILHNWNIFQTHVLALHTVGMIITLLLANFKWCSKVSPYHIVLGIPFPSMKIPIPMKIKPTCEMAVSLIPERKTCECFSEISYAQNTFFKSHKISHTLILVYLEKQF